jgi:rhamnulose-1-phosphate aldolase
MSLEEQIAEFGAVGRRLAEIESTEGAAGNLSILVGIGEAVPQEFDAADPFVPPVILPELDGAQILATASGKRLRDVMADPYANLVLVEIGTNGASGTVRYAAGKGPLRPTSEINTHLALHAACRCPESGFHAVVHAQPLHLTFLTHIRRYQDEMEFNRRLLRWQPETILQMPEGLGVLPFLIPGSEDLMRSTVEKMESCQMVVWGKHGVVARSRRSLRHAADLVEYAETSARYEHMNLVAGEPAEGLTNDEMRWIAKAFGLKQRFFA